jgi:hypothetical protein
MFLRQVTGPQGVIPAAARQLLQFHPLVITSFVEDYWRTSPENARLPAAWPAQMTARIIQEFGALNFNVANPPPTSWDHLIYAYLIENTRILDIFAKVMEACCSCEQLGTLSTESQMFLRTTQALIFSDPPPTTIWNVTGWGCPDEISQRMATYWSMFGIELNHAADIAAKHQYAKPAGANVDFIETFEALASMAWRGIVNVHNFAGPNDTDNQAIVSAARRLFCMFAARRQGCNLAREEFRAVAVMSWLHLTVSFDSPIVIDLRAQASCPEERLYRIAQRVGMTAHPRSQALFALAQPFSELLRLIENGGLDNTVQARNLYASPGGRSRLESVIGNYSIAMGYDVKALPVAVVTGQVHQPPVQLNPRGTFPRIRQVYG